MALHLIKLCVGCDSVEDLTQWIDGRMRSAKRAGGAAEYAHVTRTMPKRRAELLAGGSLYWVIRGLVRARQRILDVRAVVDHEGTQRCALVLKPEVVATEWQPRRPFQGWRYLTAAEAPRDLATRSGGDDLPPSIQAELAVLGLR